MTYKAALIGAVLVFGVTGCEPKAPDSGSVLETTSPAQVVSKCNSAEGFFDFLVSLGAFDDWSESPVMPVTVAGFTPLDGKPTPEALVYRLDGNDVTMPADTEGEVIFEASALDPEGGGELCIVDPARAEDPPGGLDFAVNVEFVFKKNPKGYTLETLEKGAETTSQYFSRTIDAANLNDMASVMGTMDWVIISRPQGSEGTWTAPAVSIMDGQEAVLTLAPDMGENILHFPIAKIREAGGDRLSIEGHDYKLAAIFNLDTIPDDYKSKLGFK